MKEHLELECEECGAPAFEFDDDGVAICEDCALENYSELEDLLRIALNDKP